MEKLKDIELLVPAGSYENLKVAIYYGADAVYIGGQQFGLRAKAKNFSLDTMKEAVAYSHARQVKVYVTANIIAHNQDLEGARTYFKELNQLGIDGIIIADPGMLMLAKEELNDSVELHLSTQANNTNYQALNFWYQQGVQRAVVARELSLAEVAEIRANIPYDMEIEAFVHGAMCISYSGRCLLSNYMAGSDANQGACKHPCRWKYHLVEKQRPGEYMPIEENQRGSFIFNSKDLCLIDHVDDIIKSGVTSLKIEGRMKTALYVATVTRAYRRAIDLFLEDPVTYEKEKDKLIEEVKKCSYRPFTKGFNFGRPGDDGQIYTTASYIRNHSFVAKGLGYDPEKNLSKIEQRNKFVLGDELEILLSNGESVYFIVKTLYNEDMEPVDAAPHPQQILYIEAPVEMEWGMIIRKKDDQI